MDHEWTERLITVVDENREMCLMSGEIIPVNITKNIHYFMVFIILSTKWEI